MQSGLMPINYPDMIVEEDFMDKFKSIFKMPIGMHIVAFEQIGFHDPFPCEPNQTNFVLPKTFSDEVYKFKRGDAGQSPFLHYFPSQAILFKIMRACIDIQYVDDLWYKRLMKKIEKKRSCKNKRLMMKSSKTLMLSKYSTTTMSDEGMKRVLNKINEATVIREKINEDL